jgi:hypothetical protein
MDSGKRWERGREKVGGKRSKEGRHMIQGEETRKLKGKTRTREKVNEGGGRKIKRDKKRKF